MREDNFYNSFNIRVELTYGPSNAGDQASKYQKKQPGPNEPDTTQEEGTGEEKKTKKGGKRSKIRTPTMSSPPSLTDPA